MVCITPKLRLKFLSTLPARGATASARLSRRRPRYFYPRSPRGERQEVYDYALQTAKFLSTLPARGATYFPAASRIAREVFLSTLPARGATS